MTFRDIPDAKNAAFRIQHIGFFIPVLFSCSVGWIVGSNRHADWKARPRTCNGESRSCSGFELRIKGLALKWECFYFTSLLMPVIKPFIYI